MYKGEKNGTKQLGSIELIPKAILSTTQKMGTKTSYRKQKVYLPTIKQQ